MISPVEALQSVIVARNYSMKASGAKAVPDSGTGKTKEGPRGGEAYIIEGTEGTFSVSFSFLLLLIQLLIVEIVETKGPAGLLCRRRQTQARLAPRN
jgi:hypothetical protein